MTSTIRLATLALVPLSMCVFQDKSSAQTAICQAQIDAVKRAQATEQQALDGAKSTADQELEGDKEKYNACMSGTLSFPEVHWVMRIPEFRMTDKKMSMHLPQVTMRDKETIFHTPSVRCDTGVIAHQPVTVCEAYKPFEKPIPKCKVEMRPIVGRRCEPFMQEQRFVLGVPEVKYAVTEWIMGVPEVTMKDHNWHFKWIKFNPESGCVGPDCAEKCKGIMEGAGNRYNQRVTPAANRFATAVSKASHEVNLCVRESIVTQRDIAVAQFDAGISRLDTTIEMLKARGAGDQIPTYIQQRDQMIAERKKLIDQMDAEVAKIDALDKSMLDQMSPTEKGG